MFNELHHRKQLFDNKHSKFLDKNQPKIATFAQTMQMSKVQDVATAGFSGKEGPYLKDKIG
jgi:hypothetical protein